MLKIGDFSRICQVSIKTLRYYDRLDLLKPAQVDDFTGHRFYSLSQMPRLNRILALKDMDLSLEQIGQLLDDELSAEQMQGILQLKQAELEAEMAATRARLSRVAQRVQLMKEENHMPEYEVVLKTLESQTILSLREIVPQAADIEVLIMAVADAIKQHAVPQSGPLLTLYHHQGFRDTDLDVEVAVPVPADFSGSIKLDDDRTLSVRELPGHETAATVIEDGHNEIWDGSYGAIGRWIETNEYEIVYPTREIYQSGPDSPDGWVIEIQFAVQKKEAEIA